MQGIRLFKKWQLYFLLVVILASSLVKISATSASECAQIVSPAYVESASSFDSLTPLDTQVVDQVFTPVEIRPVDVTINSNQMLPPLNCVQTSIPDVLLSLPLCLVFQDQVQITATPAPGSYRIVCSEGSLVQGYSPLYREGILKVLAVSLPAPTAVVTPTPTPTAVVVPTPTPTAVVVPTPTPTAVAAPTPTTSRPTVETKIDTGAKLKARGPQQKCSTFSTPQTTYVESTELDSNQIDGSSIVPTYQIAEISPADYLVYEGDSIPNIDCFVSTSNDVFVALPKCRIYAGDSELSGTQIPGVFEIKCDGPLLADGFTPLLRTGNFVVEALPRIAVQPQPSKEPTAIPAPEPTQLPTPSPVASPQATAPSILPTTNPKPLPTPATSKSPVVPSKSPQSLLEISTANSIATLFLGSSTQLYVSGGSGGGRISFKSLSSDTCSVSDEGLVTALKVGACKISISKESDSTFLASVPVDVAFGILSQVAPSKAPQPIPTPVPSKSSGSKKTPNSLSARDFIITLDPRLQVNGTRLQISASSTSIGSKTAQISTLQFKGLDRAYSYATNLIFPNGSSIELVNSFSSDSTLMTQYFQLLRKGTYKILIRKIGDQSGRLITLKVS